MKIPKGDPACRMHKKIDSYIMGILQELEFLNEKKLEAFWDLNPSLCVNCGHPVRRGYEYGNMAHPFKIVHWIDGYGSKQCPNCDCRNPEHSLPDPKEET